VLAEVARVLREGVRSFDTVGRYGGDEFVAILPQTTESEAERLAGRFGWLIRNANIAGLDEPLSASIGVAEWVPGLSAEQLLSLADRALIVAKAQGRGVVSTSRVAA
jgi:diguanylate cyclase (GGDEF)-like protein